MSETNTMDFVGGELARAKLSCASEFAAHFQA